MIFSEESGIKITREIIDILKKCVQTEGKASILAKRSEPQKPIFLHGLAMENEKENTSSGINGRRSGPI